MKRYKAWTRSPRYFTTLAAAAEYANAYFRRTGNIAAITEVKAKPWSAQDILNHAG